eukprot:scaffold35525_cov118-Isochrysis_galbana.AAC.7
MTVKPVVGRARPGRWRPRRRGAGASRAGSGRTGTFRRCLRVAASVVKRSAVRGGGSKVQRRTWDACSGGLLRGMRAREDSTAAEGTAAKGAAKKRARPKKKAAKREGAAKEAQPGRGRSKGEGTQQQTRQQQDAHNKKKDTAKGRTQQRRGRSGREHPRTIWAAVRLFLIIDLPSLLLIHEVAVVLLALLLDHRLAWLRPVASSSVGRQRGQRAAQTRESGPQSVCVQRKLAEGAAREGMPHLLKHRVVLADVAKGDHCHHHTVPAEHVADLAHLLETLVLHLRLDLSPTPPRLREGTLLEVRPTAAATHGRLDLLAPDAHAVLTLPLQVVARLASLERCVERRQVVAVRPCPPFLAPRELDLQRRVVQLHLAQHLRRHVRHLDQGHHYLPRAASRHLGQHEVLHEAVVHGGGARGVASHVVLAHRARVVHHQHRVHAAGAAAREGRADGRVVQPPRGDLVPARLVGDVHHLWPTRVCDDAEADYQQQSTRLAKITHVTGAGHGAGQTSHSFMSVSPARIALPLVDAAQSALRPSVEAGEHGDVGRVQRHRVPTCGNSSVITSGRVLTISH